MPLPTKRESIKPPVSSENNASALDEERLVASLGDRIVDFLIKLLKPKDQSNSNIDMSKPKFSVLSSILQGHDPEEKEGNVTLSVAQVTAIETALADAAAAKVKADNDLAAANTAKTTAENSLSEAVTALDDLGSSVKEAKDVKAKVEAIRAELAKKPGVSATGAQGASDDLDKIVINGADEITEYAKSIC